MSGPGARALTIASRRSALALAQTGQVRALLAERLGVPVGILEVTSGGDVDPRDLAEIGGTGVFVGALRAAVQARDADLAVHSLKDLPTAPEPGLRLAAVPERADPADVLVAGRPVRTLADLPSGARVGTGSPRRAAQLAALRPDLEVRPIRGNVDTRIGKVHSGELDAVVLARAGLERLGRLEEAAYVFPPEEMVPAPGQGALALECRAADAELGDRLAAALDDPATRACVLAERAVLAALGAGCSAPVGALASIDAASGSTPATLTLTAVVGGTVRAQAAAAYEPGRDHAATTLGEQVARQLIAAGALVERAPDLHPGATDDPDGAARAATPMGST